MDVATQVSRQLLSPTSTILLALGGVPRISRAIHASGVQRRFASGMAHSFPAIFVRGGTSNGLLIHRKDLPPEADWPGVLPAAMGSPDPVHARQLDGMGSGVSSTSKICILAPTEHKGADVEFTFVQVGIRDGTLDKAGNCGNMSSAVGPVALDEGMVPEPRIRTVEGDDGEGPIRVAEVRVFNTNTRKVIHSRFRVAHDEATGRLAFHPRGSYAIAGVPGSGSRVTLRFADPAGAATGRGALPTGKPVDVLQLSAGASVEASLVDVGNPGVFVRAADVGVQGLDPAAVEADSALKRRLEEVRGAGAVRMGLDPAVQSVPKIVLLFPPEPAAAEAGAVGLPEKADLRCLALSMGQAHKAVPLTLALCLGAAAGIEGSLAASLLEHDGSGHGRMVRTPDGGGTTTRLVIRHPSGMVEVGTTVDDDGMVRFSELHRTARIMMKGDVFY